MLVCKRSKRQHTSDAIAQKVCRELSYLIVRDGFVGGNNNQQLIKLMNAWMNKTGKIKYERPQ